MNMDFFFLRLYVVIVSFLEADHNSVRVKWESAIKKDQFRIKDLVFQHAQKNALLIN